MNNAYCLTFITINIKGIQNNSKRLSVVEHFRRKSGNNRILFLQETHSHLMMKLFERVISMDLPFTHIVTLSPVVSLLLVLEILTFWLTIK